MCFLIMRTICYNRKTQLWVIPNALTLGELKVLYSMLDSDSQKNSCKVLS